MIRPACKSCHRCGHNPSAVLATTERNADLSRKIIMHGPLGHLTNAATDAYKPRHGTNPRHCQPKNQSRQAVVTPPWSNKNPTQSHAGPLKHATCGRRWFGGDLQRCGFGALYEVLTWVWLCTCAQISHFRNHPHKTRAPQPEIQTTRRSRIKQPAPQMSSPTCRIAPCTQGKLWLHSIHVQGCGVKWWWGPP